MTLNYEAIKESRKKAKKSHGINVGSVSLIMIFTVLCLTIFAILTLVSANAEYRLSKKYSASINEYYLNDYNASEFVNSVLNYAKEFISADSILPKVVNEADTAYIAGDILCIEKTFSVSDNFELLVVLEVTNGKVEVVSYKYNVTTDYAEPEFDSNLWSGF